MKFWFIVWISFNSYLVEKSHTSIQVRHTGVIIEFWVDDLILNYHVEFIHLQIELLSYPRPYLAKCVMIKNFVLYDLTFIRVHPTVN